MNELPRLNLYHNEIEPDVAQKIAIGDYNQALYAIASGVNSFYTNPYVTGHTLYLAGFDSLLMQLGKLMHDDPQGKGEWTPGSARMVIMSEFNSSGGHSPVTADLVDAMGGAVVVLTDLFSHYQTGIESIETAIGRMPKAMVYRLLKLNLDEKVRELQTIFRAVQPASVLFMVHHQDPIAYVAAASLPASVNKVFIHHCDHNPALGGTLEGYRHVDFTQHLQSICSEHLQCESILLPLYAPDLGVKTFTIPTPNTMNIVTSGSSVKYTFEGPFAYHLVLVEILTVYHGIYWHIGALDDSKLELIKSTLRDHGIDNSRFNYIPWVPSLWGALKELDGHVFLGSFPVGGGRASIEAQGCGYPVIHFSSVERPPLLTQSKVYAASDLNWFSVPELIEKLKTASENHQYYVALTRDFYMRMNSHDIFLNALVKILT